MEEKFKKINAAYAVLSDPVQRSQYDRYGSTGSQSYSTGQQYSQQSYDPFWDMFGGSGSSYDSNRRYTYTWTSGQKEEYQPTRGESFSMLLKNGLTLVLGLFFFRYSFLIFFPIGPILAIATITSGVSGVLRSIKYLFKPKSKTGGNTE